MRYRMSLGSQFLSLKYGPPPWSYLQYFQGQYQRFMGQYEWWQSKHCNCLVPCASLIDVYQVKMENLSASRLRSSIQRLHDITKQCSQGCIIFRVPRNKGKHLKSGPFAFPANWIIDSSFMLNLFGDILNPSLLGFADPALKSYCLWMYLDVNVSLVIGWYPSVSILLTKGWEPDSQWEGFLMYLDCISYDEIEKKNCSSEIECRGLILSYLGGLLADVSLPN